MPDSQPEAEATRALLDSALAGDAEAQKRLFVEYSGFLRALARAHSAMSVLRRRQIDEEDVAQEAWRETFQKEVLTAFEWRGPGSLRRLLATVLNRTAQDLLKGEQAEKRGGGRAQLTLSALEDTRGVIQVSQEREAAPTASARDGEMDEIAEGILGARLWEIWRLSQRESYTSEEIGRRLGLSDSHVRKLLGQARRQLLEGLASVEEDRA